MEDTDKQCEVEMENAVKKNNVDGLEIGQNIALGVYTYNSSAYVINSTLMLTSFFAVDGENSSDGSSTFCSVTVPGFEPHWIGLDLENIFTICYAIVYAGSDKVDLPTKNDLNFFIVGVSNRSLDVHPPVRGTYDLCAQYPGVVASKQVVQLNCSSTTPPARYVILQQSSNSTGYMSVCEFEVYGTPFGIYRKNILLHQPASSSSVYRETTIVSQCSPFVADLAVDGFHDTQLLDCHCGHGVDSVGGPNWFMVDIQDFFYVDYVTFTSRVGYYGRHRMDNFYIGFTNTPGYQPIRKQYPLCGQWSGYVVPGSKVLMKCNANLLSFRYLIAQQAADAFDGNFASCELQAFSALSRDFFVWKKNASSYLSGYRVQTMSVRSAVECLHRVRKVGGCDSINFNAASKTCELNKHQNGYSGLDLNANWAFYVVQYY
ncbi:hypothetical protein HELRODRAFT_175371 [Helobdella robusta]|uniref:Apple domain-containing protein n=1 Tax=Helobdella robusta TaxID=6412 RepID=T1F973_HELRO|nr:hypothetical protein HELRODRAFT_175371 [Helobdella robusta]ESO00874.1 hypothetical protein HELRODRAFT_175371 [Helobdella robusta]